MIAHVEFRSDEDEQRILAKYPGTIGEDGEHRYHAITTEIAWLCIAVGIGTITEKVVDEWVYRYNMIRLMDGNLDPADGKNITSGMIGRQVIRDHVGIRVPVSYETFPEWLERRVLTELTRRANLYTIQTEIANGEVDADDKNSHFSFRPLMPTSVDSNFLLQLHAFTAPDIWGYLKENLSNRMYRSIRYEKRMEKLREEPAPEWLNDLTEEEQEALGDADPEHDLYIMAENAEAIHSDIGRILKKRGHELNPKNSGSGFAEEWFGRIWRSQPLEWDEDRDEFEYMDEHVHIRKY